MKSVYDICGVQPMTGPTNGLVFAMRAVYPINPNLSHIMHIDNFEWDSVSRTLFIDERLFLQIVGSERLGNIVQIKGHRHFIDFHYESNDIITRSYVYIPRVLPDASLLDIALKIRHK